MAKPAKKTRPAKKTASKKPHAGCEALALRVEAAEAEIEKLKARLEAVERPKSRAELLEDLWAAPQPNAGDGSGRVYVIDAPGPEWGA